MALMQGWRDVHRSLRLSKLSKNFDIMVPTGHGCALAFVFRYGG